ncbi:hypothetical protein D3C80_1488560 [compost metagenome]
MLAVCALLHKSIIRRFESAEPITAGMKEGALDRCKETTYHTAVITMTDGGCLNILPVGSGIRCAPREARTG